jgi:arylsulfatase A-like enzyme
VNKKNIVVIMTDQQRADLRALEGYPLNTTPYLDELARKGCWFNHAYTTMPVCGPARTSLITGRWPSSHRVNRNDCLRQAEYEKDLFAVAKDNHYATALIGKNHSPLIPDQAVDYHYLQGHWGGFQEEKTDMEASYDEWLKSLSQVSMTASPFPLECQLPYRAVSAAKRWIDSLEEQPFLMWLSFPEPHNPYQAPEPYYSMFPPEKLPPLGAGKEDRLGKGEKWVFYGEQMEHFLPDHEDRVARARSNYLGMLRLIDDQIRRLVLYLEENHMLDNTLIVFLSDHGDFVGEYGLMKKGPEAPDVLSRIPMQFYGAGIPAREAAHDAHVSLADVMPTLCEVMETEIPMGVQGRSLWGLLNGEEYPKSEFASVMTEHGYGGLYHLGETLEDMDTVGSVTNGIAEFNELNRYTQSGWLRTIRKDAWKLNMDMLGRGELYNISHDPLELNNLYDSSKIRDIQCEMLGTLSMWLIRTQTATLPDSQYYPIKRHPRNYLNQ